MSEVAVKPGRHRESTLYHALHGAGAGDGRTLEQLREAALKVYESAGAAGVAALGLLDDELRGAGPRRAGGAPPQPARARGHLNDRQR